VGCRLHLHLDGRGLALCSSGDGPVRARHCGLVNERHHASSNGELQDGCTQRRISRMFRSRSEASLPNEPACGLAPAAASSSMPQLCLLPRRCGGSNPPAAQWHSVSAPTSGHQQLSAPDLLHLDGPPAAALASRSGNASAAARRRVRCLRSGRPEQGQPVVAPGDSDALRTSLERSLSLANFVDQQQGLDHRGLSVSLGDAGGGRGVEEVDVEPFASTKTSRAWFAKACMSSGMASTAFPVSWGICSG
jgi:hypothetical protein